MALYFNLLGANNTWTGGPNTFAPSVANTNPVAINLGTLTADTKGLNVTGIWNNAGVTFSGVIFVNMTNTASNTISKLLQLQTGGVDVLTVDRAGNLSAAASVTSLTVNASGILSIGSGGRIQGVSGSAFITFPAAATIQFGFQDANPPVAQSVFFQNATGNNISGANATIRGSVSTGSGTSGDIILATGGTGAGTAVQNSGVTGLTIKGATQAVVVASGKTFQLGNAATTGLTAGVLAAITNASIVITDSTGQAYRIPCII